MFSSSPIKREFEDDSDVVLDQYYMEDSKRARHHHWNLNHLYTLPYSPLATVDLQSIFNLSNFQLLSQEKRDELCQLLPVVDTIPQSTLTVSPLLFSKQENPIFWSTLSEPERVLSQDEPIKSESPKINGKPKKIKSKPRKPKTIKDESFETCWTELVDTEKASNVAGDSKNITLKDMCRKGLIREQDVIVYKRNFSACKTVVCKSMTIIKASGLSGISIQLDDQVFEDFETPTALETKILDHHGKVTKDQRPNGNAFKSIRLIREGKDMGRLFDIRKDSFEEL
ncbi:hypothetical protein G6F37_001930 [Rhizopus arrhizus]|nr:hypothetical protein G6F38_003886 [Rhizopus arrhizus]KAG1162678.1 hypothetical protein G6F37_001930 [Rhizopus arrhizus]